MSSREKYFLFTGNDSALGLTVTEHDTLKGATTALKGVVKGGAYLPGSARIVVGFELPVSDGIHSD